MAEKPFIYHIITGETISVSTLSLLERGTLRLAVIEYGKKPSRAQFHAWCGKLLKEMTLPVAPPVCQICQDLETRLGAPVAPDLAETNLAELADLLRGPASDQPPIEVEFFGCSDMIPDRSCQ